MNSRPIIGQYNVNNSGSSDMYYKGGNMLHMIRQLVNDDEKWRQLLRGLNKDFYHQTVSSKQIETYIIEKTGLDLAGFFDQYLRTVKIPKFEYKINGKKLTFKFGEIVENFKMPLVAIVNGKEVWIEPTAVWQTKTFPTTIDSIKIKDDFYVGSEEIKD
jgi:aminopeptidase N